MIVESVTLHLSQIEAFKLFTARISEWWPPDRRHTKDALSEIFLLASGRFYERARDGQEIELGRVTQWDEPHRIVLDFYIATGPDRPTAVEIRFEPEGSSTRVTVIHGPKPESALLWEGNAPRYAASWRIVLAALRALASPELDNA